VGAVGAGTNVAEGVGGTTSELAIAIGPRVWWDNDFDVIDILGSAAKAVPAVRIRQEQIFIDWKDNAVMVKLTPVGERNRDCRDEIDLL